MLNSTEFIEIIRKSKYSFKIHEHADLHTVEDSKKLRGEIEGAHTKNLFLKNKKNNFFLISCEENSKINLREISKSLNLGNVSFAKTEHLYSYLGIRPGSVSPFALLNDNKHFVSFFLEDKLHESEILNFHPLVNSITISIPANDFISFMIENNKKIHIFSSTNYEIIKTYEQY